MGNAQPGRIRRFALTIGAVFSMLMLGVGTATPATLATGGDVGDHARTVVVRLLERPPFVGDADNPQPGDLLLFQEPAVNASGQTIGDSVTRVQVFQDGKYLLDCTVRIPGGNLVFSGEEDFANVATASTFAVTGGTGRFSGAGGQVVATPTTVQGAAATLLTFQLVR
jgi:hypothetical protein